MRRPTATPVQEAACALGRTPATVVVLVGSVSAVVDAAAAAEVAAGGWYDPIHQGYRRRRGESRKVHVVQ